MCDCCCILDSKLDIIQNLIDGKIVVTHVLKTYENKILRKVSYLNEDKVIHRDDDLPASILYSEDGKNIVTKAWFKNGKKHRDGDKPAEIVYAGAKVTYTWCQNDEIHRTSKEGDKPALITYEGNKVIDLQLYKNSKKYYSGPGTAMLKYTHLNNTNRKKVDEFIDTLMINELA